MHIICQQSQYDCSSPGFFNGIAFNFKEVHVSVNVHLILSISQYMTRRKNSAVLIIIVEEGKDIINIVGRSKFRYTDVEVEPPGKGLGNISEQGFFSFLDDHVDLVACVGEVKGHKLFFEFQLGVDLCCNEVQVFVETLFNVDFTALYFIYVSLYFCQGYHPHLQF